MTLLSSPEADHRSETRSFVRGSSLLLGGRFIALVINLLVQVVIVRYLSLSDYGAFAYGIGAASIGASLVLLGLDKSAARFVAIFKQRDDLPKAFGTIVLAIAIVAAAGTALVAFVYGFRGSLLGTFVADQSAFALLLVLICLAPIDALDNLLQGQLTIFAGPKAIFFRRHILGPGLKLTVVLLVVAAAGDVTQLAWGYVAGGAIGLSTYAAILGRAWQKQNLLRYLRLSRIVVPAREVLGYSLPLVSSEIVLILRGSFAVILLESLHSTLAVGGYRAVLPLAKLNLVAMQSFAFLFIPVASRMFVANDRKGMNDLYWQTALLVAILTFPVAATTFSLATPFTIRLLGEEYAGSATVLMVLAAGYYFHAALGFNQHVLRVNGNVRFIVIADILAAGIGLGVSLLLIPEHGAMGGALGTTAASIAHNLLNQIGLAACRTGVRLGEVRYVGVYLLIAALLAALLGMQLLFEPPVYVAVLGVLLASLLLIRVTSRVVLLKETFPELLRVPLLRKLFE